MISKTGLRLDDPNVGDCVTVRVKGPEGRNPHHYRQTTVLRVIAVNAAHVVVEFTEGDHSGRREVWARDEHDFYDADELSVAMTSGNVK